jgi:hypothetical protein
VHYAQIPKQKNAVFVGIMIIAVVLDISLVENVSEAFSALVAITIWEY